MIVLILIPCPMTEQVIKHIKKIMINYLQFLFCKFFPNNPPYNSSNSQICKHFKACAPVISMMCRLTVASVGRPLCNLLLSVFICNSLRDGLEQLVQPSFLERHGIFNGTILTVLTLGAWFPEGGRTYIFRGRRCHCGR